MDENEDEWEADGRGHRRCVGNTPSDAGKEHEERKEVGEGGIGSVVCVLGFCKDCEYCGVEEDDVWERDVRFFWAESVINFNRRREPRVTESPYMVVNGPKHFLRGYQQRRHLPNGHFEIHLRKFEESRQGALALIN